MKKIIAVLVVFALLLTACSITNDKKEEPVSSEQASVSEETEKTADDILVTIVNIEEARGSEGIVDETTVREKYEELTNHLIEEGLTITTMESCTAGQVASLITDTEGASAVLKGAFVTYSNEAKIAQGVPRETIEKYGVYSAETALAMAEACRDAMNADIGIGVTGSFENVDPNNADSAPGEVYFAIADKNGTRPYHCTLPVQPTRLSYKLYISDVIADKLSHAQPKLSSEIRYRYASKDEGKELKLSNDAYYSGFSQNELDYKMQMKNAKMDEYLKFTGEQFLDFTDEEKKLTDSYLMSMQEKLKENNYILPKLDEIIFIKTSMKEEAGAGGYTHGTQIYISSRVLDMALNRNEETKKKAAEYLELFFWHELFHCLTRCNPEFRAQMYKLIHFTVQDKDFTLPKSVMEYHISNPDVEHHNAYATFRINGKDIDCFCDLVTTKHFEREGETFFDFSTTALIPIDGSDIYYTPEQAENFDEIFGTNTGYVTDPEECMADNFSYAMSYGIDGPNGEGYPNPEIIEGILSYVSGH